VHAPTPNRHHLLLLPAQVLTEYFKEDSKHFVDMPLVQKNNLEELLELRECLEYAGFKLQPLPENLPPSEPIFLPPPPNAQQQLQLQQQQQQQQQQQLQQPQKPGWISWLEQPEQRNNVLFMAYAGDVTGRN